MGCLFCRIAAKEIPANLVWESEHAVAFRDLHPVAPNHVLVIPKQHVPSLAASGHVPLEELGALLSAARDVAEKEGLAARGYRVVINSGADGGQSVFHLHLHVIGGRALGWPPFPG